MSIWLFRAGKNGEYEEKFLTDNRIYLGHNLRVFMSPYIARIKDYKQVKIFDKALVKSSIMVLDKQRQREVLHYQDMSMEDEIEIPIAQLEEKWFFAEENEEGQHRFGNYFKVSHVVATLLNKAYVLSDGTYREADNCYICHDCNHNKSSFWIEEDYYDKLYPDGEEIKNTFVRDEQYYICINDAYKETMYIIDFYDKVRLGSELHRLDYLLMNIIGLQNKCHDSTELYAGLGKIKDAILQKRNIM